MNSTLQRTFEELVEKCGPTRLLKLIVEPMKNQRRVEYRIVDSQLAPGMFDRPPLTVKMEL